MTTFKIEYDISELKKLVKEGFENAPEQSLPNTAKAFVEATRAIEMMWQDVISSMPGVTPIMVKSIRSRKNGDFDYSIFSENQYLEKLNNGSKEVEYDMKKTHPYGKKSRVSKKGIPYLIIKFRWRTPGQSNDTLAHGQYFSSIIPTKYYNTSVKGLNISSENSLKNYWEKNFRGESIERHGYDWAKFGRLTDAQAWDDRSRGMVRMLDDSKPGRITSTYFTFRIISAKSPVGSWIYHKNAKPGTNYFNSIVQAAQMIAEQKIKAGVKADEDFFKNQM